MDHRTRSPKPSQPPRRPTPGEYSFADSEEPTQPGAPKAIDRWDTLARLMANLSPDERRELTRLADDWYRCTANRRALVGALANELAG